MFQIGDWRLANADFRNALRQVGSCRYNLTTVDIGNYRLGIPEMAIILVIVVFIRQAVAKADPPPKTFGAPFFTALGVLLAVFTLIEFWL